MKAAVTLSATHSQAQAKSREVSTWKAIILGIQHLLAMYSGDILVPLLIGGALHFNSAQMTYLVSADIFMCGIATLLQLRTTPLTGIGLPVVLGCAVQAVSPLESIGGTLGITYMYGAIICAGIFVFLIAGLFARIKNLFPPVVTGSLITVIGFTLVPVGFQNLGGGDVTAKSFGSVSNLAIGFITILIIIAVNAFAKGFIKSIAILIGIVAGSLIAGAMGIVSLNPVAQASWFHLPQFFYFGVPTFNTSSIVTMMLVSITTMIESTGVYFALSDVTGMKLKTNDLKRGYRAEGIAAVLGGLFNTFPYSTFSQNVGVLKLSGVKTRKPVYFAAFFLVLLGLLPKFAAIATIIPSAVLGGAMIVMFGMVGVQGIQILKKVDFSKNSNLMVASMSIGLGLGVTVYPQIFQHLSTEWQLMLSNGVVVGSVTAVILNLILNHDSFKKNTAKQEATE
ncbi:nucleobase:cation symporter-2 family protein [Paucilactobacillus suebicus]|uniref:Xanthine uracil permease n=1 Tax=Paucilactobacillus suebicus DSM 5007 = KCTC 3549 TaxID=1423807 RepID=A0A0R1W981_9LACO|nr:nucleobase:cation symporter-2 family protein [Paucilactobacillus suebicus]KRM12395.1 xanthine uracil permease [Paucilactobacillus suebicus DSM 5007 = KCTC 3549]